MKQGIKKPTQTKKKAKRTKPQNGRFSDLSPNVMEGMKALVHLSAQVVNYTESITETPEIGAAVLAMALGFVAAMPDCNIDLGEMLALTQLGQSALKGKKT